MTTFVSQTQYGKNEDFNLQVARGQIQGHSTVNIYGYNPAVSDTVTPVWENATAYTYPAAATVMHLASSNNADTATITIQGLDSGYSPISESLVLTGTTVVNTTKSYLRINSMFVSVGSTTNPAGVITLKDLTNTTIYAQINAGIGRTQMSIYTVPTGYTFYLARVAANTSLNGNNAKFMTYRSYTVTSAGVVNIVAQAPFTQSYDALRIMPRPYLEKTDIQFQVVNSSATSGGDAANIAVEGYLIKNSTD